MKRLLPLVIAALALSCTPKKPTAVILRISAEPPAPGVVDALSIHVDRDGSPSLDESLPLPGDTALPGTLTLANDDGHDPSSPITVRVRVDKGGKPFITRVARLGMIDRHTKVLRLALRYVCAGATCPEGQTCVDGACSSIDVDASSLPDEDAAGAADAACFDDARCFADATDVTPLACTFAAPAGAFNVGVAFSSAPSYLVALDRGRDYSIEGGQVRLLGKICDLVGNTIVRVATSSACAPKDTNADPCAPPPFDGGGGQGGAAPGGNGGTAGASGGNATGGAGTSGNAGLGGAGTSGNAGAAGIAGVGGNAGAPMGGSGGSAGGGNGGVGAAGSNTGGAGAGGLGGGAGVGGASGASGVGGSAGSSGGPCVGPPQIVTAPMVAADAEMPFTLDASLTKDGHGVAGSPTLLFAWSVVSGPPLAGTSSSIATGNATSCGTYAYQLAVSDSACGAQGTSTTTVMVAVKNDGPYVASCATSGCGTKTEPWCDIASAVAASPPGKAIYVGAGDFADDLHVASGPLSISGGWDATFQSQTTGTTRLHPPATNGLEILPGGDVTIDAIDLVVDAALASAGVTVNGGGALHLSRMTLSPSVAQPASVAAGVVVTGPGGGTLSMDACDVVAPAASMQSSALYVDGTSSATITTNATSFDATGGGTPDAVAVRALGTGAISLTGGTISASNASVSNRALMVSGATSVSVSGASLSAADPVTEVAHVDGVPTALFDMVTVYSSAAAAGASVTGLALAAVDSAHVSGGSYTATQAMGAPLATATGVSVSPNQAGTSTLTIDTGAVIEGGGSGDTRIGLDADSTKVSIDASFVRGSTATGGLVTTGVSLHGTLPSGTVDAISGSTLDGGSPSPPLGMTFTARGLAWSATGGSLLMVDTQSTGCSPLCTNVESGGAVGAGIDFAAGAGHVVTNGTISGGAVMGMGASLYGIRSLGAGVTVHGGTIGGGTDATNHPDAAYGVSATDASLSIDGATIRGGYGITATGVQASGSSAWPVVTITGSTVSGGTFSGRGVDLTHVTPTVGLDAIDACGLGAICDGASGNDVGLLVYDGLNAQIWDNYVFGGTSSNVVACDIGNDGTATYAGGTQFVYNLCDAFGASSGSTTVRALNVTGAGSTGAIGLGITGNLFAFGGSPGDLRGAYELASPTSYTFVGNAFVANAWAGGGQVYASYYHRASNVEAWAQQDLDALFGAGADVLLSSATPWATTPSATSPTPTQYELAAASCPEAQIAPPTPVTTVDYFQTPRKSPATAGPYECP